MEAAVIHVPDDQPTIQAGIDAAIDGDTVIVADGTWTGEGNRDIDFLGKAITVSSENGPDNCIIDCEGSESDQHRGFLFQSGESTDSVLRGFTIHNGWAGHGGGIGCIDSSPWITGNVITENKAVDGGGIYYHRAEGMLSGNTITVNYCSDEGAGIYLQSSETAIINNEIGDNQARVLGGGIHCYGSSPKISSNFISMNSVYNTISLVTGGGGISLHNSSPLIDRNTITDNVTTNVDFPYYTSGGGIYCRTDIPWSDTIPDGHQVAAPRRRSRYGYQSAPTISNNIISGNIAGSDGTHGGSGGGIYAYNSWPDIINNTISSNQSDHGAGIHTVVGTNDLIDNIIIQNGAGLNGGGIRCNHGWVHLSNNVIAENTAKRGGGIYFQELTAQISSNTITDNITNSISGGVYCYVSSVVVEDTIIYGNQGQNDTQIFMSTPHGSSSLSIGYSDVEGGESGVISGPDCKLDWGDGMIDADPLFVTGA